MQESFALKTPDADGSQIMVVVDLLNALPFLGFMCQRRSNTMAFSAFLPVSLSAHVRVPSQTHTLVIILAFSTPRELSLDPTGIRHLAPAASCGQGRNFGHSGFKNQKKNMGVLFGGYHV